MQHGPRTQGYKSSFIGQDIPRAQRSRANLEDLWNVPGFLQPRPFELTHSCTDILAGVLQTFIKFIQRLKHANISGQIFLLFFKKIKIKNCKVIPIHNFQIVFLLCFKFINS